MDALRAAIVFAAAMVACTPETDLAPDPAKAAPADASGSATEPLAGKLVDPPSGATGMPTNLTGLIVGFGEPVQVDAGEAAFVLRAEAGAEVPLSLGALVPCQHVCYAVGLPAELLPATSYTVEARAGTLTFLDGKPVPGGVAGSFGTGEGADRFGPRIEEFTATVAEGCITAHVVADEPARVEIELSAGAVVATLALADVAAALDFAQPLPELPSGTAVQAVARAVDRAGNPAASQPISLTLPPALPRIVISEVLANSAGSETTQEYLEIYNAGVVPIDLGGLVIADRTGSDVLLAAVLQPAAFAIVVAEKYDPAAAGDVPPRDGTLLVRVAGRIGADGLSNAGEPVRLLTPGGDIVSQYGGWVDVSASAWSGKSVKRTGMDACDGPSAWTTAPSPATPGW